MKKFSNYSEILIILVGEIIVSAITALVYFLVDTFMKNGAFSYRVFTGAALGTAVVVANYLFLTVSVDRALKKVMALRPEGEMTEEEIIEFSEKNQGVIKNAAAASYIVRTLTMLAAFVLVFTLLKEWFAVFATLVPLLAFRPIIMAGEFFRRRKNK